MVHEPRSKRIVSDKRVLVRTAALCEEFGEEGRVADIPFLPKEQALLKLYNKYCLGKQGRERSFEQLQRDFYSLSEDVGALEDFLI